MLEQIICNLCSVVTGRSARELPVDVDAAHVVLHEESFGTRIEYSPSLLSIHRFKEVLRWEIPASNGGHDIEAPTNERLVLSIHPPTSSTGIPYHSYKIVYTSRFVRV